MNPKWSLSHCLQSACPLRPRDDKHNQHAVAVSRDVPARISVHVWRLHVVSSRKKRRRVCQPEFKFTVLINLFGHRVLVDPVRDVWSRGRCWFPRRSSLVLFFRHTRHISPAGSSHIFTSSYPKLWWTFVVFRAVKSWNDGFLPSAAPSRCLACVSGTLNYSRLCDSGVIQVWFRCEVQQVPVVEAAN